MSENADLDRRQPEIEALAAEIGELGKEIQNYTHGADKYFGLIITVIVAAITLGVSNKLPAVFVALPFALSGILLYVIQLMTERAARVGMRKFLENQLRTNASHWFVCKEDCLGNAVSQTRWSVIASTGLYILAYIFSCVVAVVTSSRLEVPILGAALPVFVLVALVGVTVAMGIAYFELIDAERVACAFMEAKYAHPDQQPKPESWRLSWGQRLKQLIPSIASRS